jgi:hypothetical protein
MMNVPPFPVGMPAPDFDLQHALGQARTQLVTFRGQKPVVLLFGSFGCDRFCNDLPRLNELRETYKNAAEFLFVYVSEAGHQVLPPREGSELESPIARIERGLRHFRVAMPCLIDGPDHAAEQAYNGFPRRLVAVDRDGKIALDLNKALQAPWDLDALERWLATITPRKNASRVARQEPPHELVSPVKR